jgi:cytochrome c
MILTINNDDGFVNLFDGRDQEGWCMAGPGRFQIIKQERALESEDGMGLLWYTKKKYNDFIRENDNSGVFVRFSDPGNDPWIAVNTGYEIQIDDLALPEGRPVHKTGAIYGLAAPATLASKPVGEWNTFEIKAIDQNYTVILNNKKDPQIVFIDRKDQP